MTSNIYNKNKTLSIRISTNGFCFCSYTPSQSSSVEYFAYDTDDTLSITANFENGWNECPFTNEGVFGNIQVIVETDTYTILPNEYDNKEEYDKQFRLCFPGKAAGYNILSNRLTAQGITILFDIDKELYELIRKKGNAKYFIPQSIILGFVARSQFEQSRYMLTFMHGKTTHIFAFADNVTTLINSFTTNEIANKTFYLLSIWKEQGLSQTEDTLYICGDSSVEASLPMLKNFIENIKRINPNEIFIGNLLNKLENVPFDLQALLLCE